MSWPVGPPQVASCPAALLSAAPCLDLPHTLAAGPLALLAACGEAQAGQDADTFVAVCATLCNWGEDMQYYSHTLPRTGHRAQLYWTPFQLLTWWCVHGQRYCSRAGASAHPLLSQAAADSLGTLVQRSQPQLAARLVAAVARMTAMAARAVAAAGAGAALAGPAEGAGGCGAGVAAGMCGAGTWSDVSVRLARLLGSMLAVSKVPAHTGTCSASSLLLVLGPLVRPIQLLLMVCLAGSCSQPGGGGCCFVSGGGGAAAQRHGRRRGG